MLGDHRSDVGRDVLDDPRPRTPAWSHRPMAIGAGREGVFLVAVDSRRRRTALAGVSWSGPLGFGSPLGGGLGVRGYLPGRCRGIGAGEWGGRFLGQLLGQGQQREDNSLLALLENQRGLLRRQLRAEQRLQRSRIQGVRTRSCHANSEMKWSSDCKIN